MYTFPNYSLAKDRRKEEMFPKEPLTFAPAKPLPPKDASLFTQPSHSALMALTALTRHPAADPSLYRPAERATYEREDEQLWFERYKHFAQDNQHRLLHLLQCGSLQLSLADTLHGTPKNATSVIFELLEHAMKTLVKALCRHEALSLERIITETTPYRYCLATIKRKASGGSPSASPESPLAGSAHQALADAAVQDNEEAPSQLKPQGEPMELEHDTTIQAALEHAASQEACHIDMHGGVAEADTPGNPAQDTAERERRKERTVTEGETLALKDIQARLEKECLEKKVWQACYQLAMEWMHGTETFSRQAFLQALCNKPTLDKETGLDTTDVFSAAVQLFSRDFDIDHGLQDSLRDLDEQGLQIVTLQHPCGAFSMPSKPPKDTFHIPLRNTLSGVEGSVQLRDAAAVRLCFYQSDGQGVKQVIARATVEPVSEKARNALFKLYLES